MKNWKLPLIIVGVVVAVVLLCVFGVQSVQNQGNQSGRNWSIPLNLTLSAGETQGLTWFIIWQTV